MPAPSAPNPVPTAPQHGAAQHGGCDALGVPAIDLSTNANACGACPAALRALQRADARHYPDPAYTALRARLADWHGVCASRIVPAASGSEFIQRISLAVALQRRQAAATVWLPVHAYGDYARAAAAAGLHTVAQPARAQLLWACEPSSPLGQAHAGFDLPATAARLAAGQTLVLDMAYAPLRLDGQPLNGRDAGDGWHQRAWRLITPNKALGLTGVRAAYAIAPADAPAALLARVHALGPSWPLGAHGAALLAEWPGHAAQDWLQNCLARLRGWKVRQTRLLQGAGWQVLPSLANFFVARPPQGIDTAALLAFLRTRGIKLRDCASFGLPGHVRMRAAPPQAQRALAEALRQFRP